MITAVCESKKLYVEILYLDYYLGTDEIVFIINSTDGMAPKKRFILRCKYDRYYHKTNPIVVFMLFTIK